MRDLLYASWEAWDTQVYLRDYCTRLDPDERATIPFLVRSLAAAPRDATVLEIGCGPTLHHIFAAAPYARQIHMADYVAENLAEIERWIEGREERHDWSEFVRYTLSCEGVVAPSQDEITAREKLTRKRITRLAHADVSRDDPLGREYRQRYPIVLSCYCADSATSDKATWLRYMRNICSLVAPGGLLIAAALRRASHYRLGSACFPSADVDESDMRRALEEHAGLRIRSLETASVPEHCEQGYTGIVLVAAERRRPTATRFWRCGRPAARPSCRSWTIWRSSTPTWVVRLSLY